MELFPNFTGHHLITHTNCIRKKYGNRAELLITDTDSLMYHIETDDFYHNIAQDVGKKFDTSDYPEKHPSGIETRINKKVIGKFKDEVAGQQTTHFIGLKGKLYSFKIDDISRKRNVKK